MTRSERRALKDKVALENGRLMQVRVKGIRGDRTKSYVAAGLWVDLQTCL